MHNTSLHPSGHPPKDVDVRLSRSVLSDISIADVGTSVLETVDPETSRKLTMTANHVCMEASSIVPDVLTCPPHTLEISTLQGSQNAMPTYSLSSALSSDSVVEISYDTGKPAVLLSRSKHKLKNLAKKRRGIGKRLLRGKSRDTRRISETSQLFHTFVKLVMHIFAKLGSSCDRLDQEMERMAESQEPPWDAYTNKERRSNLPVNGHRMHSQPNQIQIPAVFNDPYVTSAPRNSGRLCRVVKCYDAAPPLRAAAFSSGGDFDLLRLSREEVYRQRYTPFKGHPIIKPSTCRERNSMAISQHTTSMPRRGIDLPFPLTPEHRCSLSIIPSSL